ncbi:Kynurenine/alpha-aminoadipate aminotransferase, mitochondrial [Eufriesea mexicana]|uniref:Kynurenine/alpha-aminoadipate aminotransferase, mitochondrial n=1 Tax=Eufriesea mexicana TaxID=516756 RepID=A0A310SMP0_9HYME|nr:Kynurenine/alpha-aminoadipate aminotransferase, mitochondrial [Eufriesea mexicana]
MECENGINLANGMPNAKMFPFEEISVMYTSGINVKLTGNDLTWSLQYGPSQGQLPLLKKVREFQEYWHKPKYNDWDILFTSGSMDGCNKVFEMILEIGDPVMVQVPTYDGILNALAPQMPEFIEIKQDEDGIIPGNIVKVCEIRQRAGKPIPKILYVNPTGANPTGTVLTNIRRKEIYELAEMYNFIILEDDPYRFVHFVDENPTTFLELDTNGRVIRLDSFSKIISSGLRLGIVTAHKEFIKKLTIHMETTNIHPSSLSQMLIFKLLTTWELPRLQQHFDDIKKFYHQRRDIMLSLIEEHLTGLVEWNVPKGGMFIWIKVNNMKDVMELVQKKCISQRIFVLSGHAFNYDRLKAEQHIRLCYSYASPEEIDKVLGFFSYTLFASPTD